MVEHKGESSPIKVAIVEDHTMFLELLGSALNQQPGIDVVATADRVSEAKKWFRPQELDVVILDIELPDGNGVGLGITLRRENPKLGIVLLSDRDMLELIIGLPEDVREGWSYITKSTTKSIESLANVIRATSRGDSIIDSALVNRSVARPNTGVGSLTKRQFEVLRAVARGESNQSIADSLGIAENSVGNHLIAIYDTLGIDSHKNSRVAAVLQFLQDTSRSDVYENVL